MTELSTGVGGDDVSKDSNAPPPRNDGDGDEEAHSQDDGLIPFDRFEKAKPTGRYTQHRDKTRAQRRRLLPGFLSRSYLRNTPGWPVLIALAIFLFLALVVFLLRRLAYLYLNIFS
ncbi:hypothetical protein MOQ72_36020 [Saccharopolyspora sp. K220]|uniref:hypothetical protein n=1 Tax=Saccharopolyspora soli TaxID=2926618 RepID=UPI001F5A53A0|nr:hypothetical protein [Saccharopolyspora soli]MCI2422847.1 hypothetical protein [Saccharopolyspora soli]